MVQLINTLLSNKLFVAPVLAAIISQFAKAIIWSIKERKPFFRVLYKGYGGFPSSHTAFVTAVTGSVYILEGLSNLFFVALFMSLLWIIYVLDIKMLFEVTADYLDEVFDTITQIDIKRLGALMGHTYSQILGGLVVGILVLKYIFF